MKQAPLNDGTSNPGLAQRAIHPGDGDAPIDIDPLILEERRFNEAPMLAAKVASGELPPVSERLPDHPFVVRPIEEIGKYGGTIRRALTGDIIQRVGISKTLGENLMGWERLMPGSIQPHLAESYEFQDEGRVALFHIRRGLKWSDGHPFTVDDILFFLVDIQQDPDAVASVTSSDL